MILRHQDEPFLAFWSMWRSCIRGIITDRATPGRMIELASDRVEDFFSGVFRGGFFFPKAWPVACAMAGDFYIEAPNRMPVSRSLCFDLWVFFELALPCRIFDFHSLILIRWSEWADLCVQATLDSGYQTCASQYPLQNIALNRMCKLGKPFGGISVASIIIESACVKSRFHSMNCQDARACRGWDLGRISESTYAVIDQG